MPSLQEHQESTEQFIKREAALLSANMQAFNTLAGAYVDEAKAFVQAYAAYESKALRAKQLANNIIFNMADLPVDGLLAAKNAVMLNLTWANDNSVPAIDNLTQSYYAVVAHFARQCPDFQALDQNPTGDYAEIKQSYQGKLQRYQELECSRNSVIEESKRCIAQIDNLLAHHHQAQNNHFQPVPSAPPAEAVEEDLPPPYREIDVQVPSPTILSRNGSRTPSPLARIASNSSSYQAPSLFAAAQSAVDNNPWEYPANAYDKKQYRQFFVGYCGTHPDWVSQGKLPLIETSSHFARHWREACQKNNYTPAEIANIVVLKPELELHRAAVSDDCDKDFIKQQNLNKFHIIPEMDEERFKNFTLPNKQRIKIFFDYDYSDDAISLRGTHKVYRPHPDLTPWQNAQLPLLAQACEFKIPADDKHLAQIVPVDLQHIFKQSLFKPPVQASVQPQANVKKRKPKACAIM